MVRSKHEERAKKTGKYAGKRPLRAIPEKMAVFHSAGVFPTLQIKQRVSPGSVSQTPAKLSSIIAKRDPEKMVTSCHPMASDCVASFTRNDAAISHVKKQKLTKNPCDLSMMTIIDSADMLQQVYISKD